MSLQTAQNPAAGRQPLRAIGSLSVLPLFVFILLLPLSVKLTAGYASWTSITLYDWQRIGQLTAFSLAALFSIVLATPGQGEIPRRRILFLVMAVLITGGLSLLVNDVPWWDGAHEIALMSSAILACWATWRALAASAEDDWRNMACLCLAGSALLYLAVFFEWNGDALYSSDPIDPTITFLAFSNIRFFSDYQMLLFPFLVHVAAFRCHNPAARACAWLAVCLFAMLFFHTGSRVVILGQVGVHLCLVAVLRRRHLHTLVRHAWAWGGGFLLFQISGLLSPSVTQGAALKLMRDGLSLRDVIWSLSWRTILDHPWLGIGPGELSRQLNPVAAGPHNSLLMIAAEWGIPVLLATCVALCLMLHQSLKRLRARAREESDASDFAIATWLAFGALLLHSLVANVLVVPTSLASLVLASAMACAATLSPAAIPRMESTNVSRLAYGALVLGTIATIAALLMRDVPRLPDRNLAYFNCKQPTEFFSPRFWQQGWLIDVCPLDPVHGLQRLPVDSVSPKGIRSPEQGA